MLMHSESSPNPVAAPLEIMPSTRPRRMPHLFVVDRALAWKRGLVQSGVKLTKPEREALRADFRPLIEFLKELGAA